MAGEDGMRSDCLMGAEFYFGVVKMFGTGQRRRPHNMVSVLNAPEPYTLKWFPFSYVNFTSIFKKKNVRTEIFGVMSKIHGSVP